MDISSSLPSQVKKNRAVILQPLYGLVELLILFHNEYYISKVLLRNYVLLVSSQTHASTYLEANVHPPVHACVQPISHLERVNAGACNGINY